MVHTDLATGFETKLCGRCGGSGEYSYNFMHGTRCYGCNGRGVVLTKRGEVARQFFLDSIEAPLSEVKAGWMYKSGRSGKWFKVKEVCVSESKYQNGNASEWEHYINLKADITYGLCGWESIVTAVPSMEVAKDRLAAAYTYQQTLNERGKVLKRKAA